MSENDEKKNRNREGEKSRSDGHTDAPVRNRITEGPRRKGGKNKPPQVPRPDVRPKPQKPSASSSEDASGDGESDD